MPYREIKKCLVPFCAKDNHIRGLCERCYETALRMVREEFVTWEFLEERGRILKSHRKKPKVDKCVTDGCWKQVYMFGRCKYHFKEFNAERIKKWMRRPRGSNDDIFEYMVKL